MDQKSHDYLSKREKQIMDVVYRLGKATVAEVKEQLEDAPSYTSTRVQMHMLEDKGLLRHEKDGPRYVYFPSVSAEKARKTELNHVVKTFFQGSLKEAMADLIDIHQKEMGEDEWQEIYHMIDDARKQGN